MTSPVTLTVSSMITSVIIKNYKIFFDDPFFVLNGYRGYKIQVMVSIINSSTHSVTLNNNTGLGDFFPKIKLLTKKVSFTDKNNSSQKKLDYISLDKKKVFLSKIHKSKRKEDRLWCTIYCKKKGCQKAREIYRKYKSITFLTDIIYYYKSLFKIQLLEYNLFDLKKRKTILETDCFDYYYFNEEKNCYDIKYKKSRKTFLNDNNYKKFSTISPFSNYTNDK